MTIDTPELLLRIVLILPLGIAAIFLVIKSLKGYSRVFYFDYQGNSKERFKDNLVSNLYMVLFSACMFEAVFILYIGIAAIKFVPFAFCFGIFILPVGVLGLYWRSYMMNKLWGGLLPTVRTYYGYSEPVTFPQYKVDRSKLKIPRRMIFTAITIALMAFLGTFFFLSLLGWNGNPWIILLFRLVGSGLMAFAVFMTILSSYLSRRIQKMRDGEPLDDENME